MKYDKRRVYTALNADELEVGSKVIVADDVLTLEVNVKGDMNICTLTRVGSPGECSRFQVKRPDTKDTTWWFLAYLVEPPKKQMATYRELAGWLAHNNGQCMDTRPNCLTSDIVFTGFAYQLRDDNEHVPSYMKVRRWGDDEWHEVTKEYLED